MYKYTLINTFGGYHLFCWRWYMYFYTTIFSISHIFKGHLQLTISLRNHLFILAFLFSVAKAAALPSAARAALPRLSGQPRPGPADFGKFLMTIKFNAAIYNKLNSTSHSFFFFQMMGCVVSYLVITLQFGDTISGNCDCKNSTI